MNRTCASRRGLSVWTAAFAAAALALFPSVTAQTLNWVGPGGSGNWTTSTNWTDSTALNTGTTWDLVLQTTSDSAPMTSMIPGGNYTIRSLAMDNTAQVLNNTANVLRFVATTATNSTAVRTITFGTADVSIITLTNGMNLNVNASTLGTNPGTPTMTLNLGYTGNGTINIDGTSQLIVSGAGASIAGTGGLIKTGEGSIRLSANQTYSGGFTLNAGTVEATGNSTSVGVQGVFGTGVLTLNGGTIISTTTGNRNFTNPVQLNNGTLTLGSASTGSIIISDAGSQTTTLSGNTTLQIAVGANANWAQPIHGLGSLTKVGEGTLGLNGTSSTSTYEGGFELKEGNVRFTSSGNSTGTLSSSFGTGTLTLSGGSLASSNNNASNSGNRTLYNPIALNGTISLGELTANSAVTVSTAWGSESTLLKNSTIVTLANSTATTFNWNQNITGGFSLTKEGTATLTLSGLNSYTGGTTVSAGTLRGTTSGLQGAITNHAALVFSQETDGTYAGAISGSGTLAKTGAGTVTLSGTNTHTGLTSLTEGGLAINGSLAGALDTAAGTVLSGVGTIHGNAAISGAHRPGNSPGTQTFAGDLTYNTGATVGWELAANTTTAGNFDQVIVGGTLDFAGATLLSLDFAGSAVDWSHSFWLEDHSWKLYDAAALANSENLSLTIADWLDAQGDLFSAILAGSTFGLSVNGNDIYLNYTAAIPEPATTAALLGAAALALAAWRRRSLSRRD